MILKHPFTKMLALLALPICFGFNYFTTSTFTGKYASYSTGNSIELIINQDNTFSYAEKLCNGKDLKSTGIWKEKNNAILLLPNDKVADFHTKWKFDSKGQKAFSRNGMLFYTLNKVD